MSTIEEELAELRRERDAYRRRIGELEAKLEADLEDARRILADRHLGGWVRLSDRLVVNLAACEAIVFEHGAARLCSAADDFVRPVEEPGELEALRRFAARMVRP